MQHRLIPWLNGERQPEPWVVRGGLALLGGCGALLGSFQALKAAGYAHGLLRAVSASCPVISVGNLTVGGTGKTPMVMWLAQRCQASGARVAVVSRGYRQTSRAEVTVVADWTGVHLAPPVAADEAVLIARSVPGVAVVTGANRPALIRHAVEVLRCDIILMDDGFQRLDVQRDLNLVLLDARHPFGNGRLLPGGILRERPAALQRCDAMILTRADDPQAVQGACRLLTTLCPDKPVLTAIHKPTAWIPVHPPGAPLPLDGLSGAGFGFCGIAAPDRFRQTLARLPVRLVGWQAFADHHFFQEAELHQMVARAQALGAGFLLCTEKDAVKWRAGPCPLPLLALRVEMELTGHAGWLEQQIARACATGLGRGQVVSAVRP
ncbi:MAG: tetraacyldisaccharide 4'-kinase [Magnetococcales bacterium]|nr:tetraacyldisaccharide 4'-kinase [Magnetococcales bacterium]